MDTENNDKNSDSKNQFRDDESASKFFARTRSDTNMLAKGLATNVLT